LPVANTGKLISSFLAAGALWLAITCDSAGAQDTKPLSVEHALSTFKAAELVPIGISPDSKWLAYTVKNNRLSVRVDLETWAKSGLSDIFTGTSIRILNIETGESRALTNDKNNSFFPVWSPDGRYLAFLSDGDGSGQVKLWIWDTAQNTTRKVCDLRIRQFGQIEWMPDGRSMVVPILPANLSLESYVQKFAGGTLNLNGIGSEERTAGSTVILYRSNGVGPPDKGSGSDPWNLDLWLRDLAVVDVASGKASTIVRGGRVGTFGISPDGLRIAYTIPRRFEVAGSQQVLFDLLTVIVSSRLERVVASEIRLGFDGSQFSWSPDARHLAYRTYGAAESARDCFVTDIEDGSARNVTALASNQQWPTSGIPLWDRKAKNIYFISNGTLWRASTDQSKAAEVARLPSREIVQLISQSGNLLWMPGANESTIVVAHDRVNKQDGFYKINLATGQSDKLLEKSQCYTCPNMGEGRFTTVSKDGEHIAYFAEDAQHDSDLWIDDAQLQNPRRLTHLNPQFDNYKMGPARLIDWFDDDGERLHGALLLPAEYQEGRRYPLIVWVYGGSSLSDRFNHFGFQGLGPFNMQLFATRGYAVLFPDAPQHLGTPMADLARSVLPGINKAIDIGIADSERIGVIGHSYGGYSALCLVVQSKRFKAAMVADGYGDVVGHYGGMQKSGSAFGVQSEEQGQGLIGGPPWLFRDRYVENSPLFYLDRSATPLLIVHGSIDTTVPSFLGDEMFVALRRLGRHVEYAKYEGEGHSQVYWNHSNQVDFSNRMLIWFDKYLKQVPQ
jgi:dipeptidyl aminopeptidase/acylaminoacyl peptidase